MQSFPPLIKVSQGQAAALTVSLLKWGKGQLRGQARLNARKGTAVVTPATPDTA